MPGCMQADKPVDTQFGRACKELGIALIWANSAQAKGRVERMNKTQQDRLVKEFRLAGIQTIDKGNEFLEKTSYWDVFNKKFNVKAADAKDAHLAPLSEVAIDRILCLKETRTITKNLEVQYNNTIYQLVSKASIGLFGAKITVLESLDGKISFEYKGRELLFKKLSEVICSGEEVNSKEIDLFLKKHEKSKKPDKNHPWARWRTTKPTSSL